MRRKGRCGNFSAKVAEKTAKDTNRKSSLRIMMKSVKLEHLFNPCLVKGIGIFLSVGLMFGIGDSKIVAAGEILLGTHIDIGMSLSLEHALDAGHGRNADGTGR